MSKTVRSAVFVSLASVVASLANMGLHLAMARTFGANAEIDAYFAGMSLPLLLGGILSAAIGYQAVPLMVHFDEKEFSGREYRESLLFLGLVIGLALILVGSPLSWWALRYYPNAASLAANSAGLIACAGWVATSATLFTALLTAICQIQRQFSRPALLAGLAPLLGIGVCGWVAQHGGGVLLVAVILPIGYMASAGILLWRLRAELSLRWPRSAVLLRVLRDWRASPLILISMLVFTCFGTVDAYLAGWIKDGAVTCLAYAQRILVAIAGLAVNGAGVVILPRLAEAAARGEHAKVQTDLTATVRIVVAVLAPIAVVAALFAEPACRLLFGGGRFTAADVARLAEVMPYMFAGIIPMSCSTLLFRGMYALRDTIGAGLVGLSGAVFYAVLCAFLLRWNLDVRGFGIAYILCWIAVLALSVIRLRRTIGSAPQAHAMRLWLAKQVAAVSVVGAVALIIRWFQGSSREMGQLGTLLQLIEATGLCAGAYLAAAQALELREITQMLKAIAPRRKAA